MIPGLITLFKRLFPYRSIKVIIIFFILMFFTSPAISQTVLFDFDNAPLYTSLPINQTSGGITARLSATGQGYSIQNANVLGFTPPGFSGRILYPNSIFLSDLLIHYDQLITEFSIMYACQELGCDDAATMRVTAFKNGNYVGTNTRIAAFPGTWPVDTLRCSFSQGFDSVVIHYDHRPPTCQDYGTIFVADNMRVIPVPVSVPAESEISDMFTLRQNYPNPFNPATYIMYNIPEDAFIKLSIVDPLGNVVFSINEYKKAGSYEVRFDGTNLASGMYFYSLETNGFKETKKMVLIK